MTLKIATFNVNGIRARLPIVAEWLQKESPDVLCLQETKCQDEQFPVEPFSDAGYCVGLRGQKSYNGVAILTKSQPAEVLRAFDDGRADEEARFIAALVENVWVINTYVPQGRDPESPAFQEKISFFSRVRQWFETRFDPTRLVVWTGDLNVAPEPIDVFDPKRMEGKVGFHPAERKALSDVQEWGFLDLFRRFHPQERQFSFWDYRLPQSFQRNLGWRLDHIMVTRSLAELSIDCRIDDVPRSLPKASDHTPVLAEFDL